MKVLSHPEGRAKYPVADEGPVASEGTGFSGQILPIFEAKCVVCHDSSKPQAGWDASSYETVMSSGDNAPVIVPGDVENSLLAQYLQGSNGKLMPPLGGMSESDIQAILDWIAAGANNN